MTARAARTWRRTRGDQGCARARRVAGPCPPARRAAPACVRVRTSPCPNNHDDGRGRLQGRTLMNGAEARGRTGRATSTRTAASVAMVIVTAAPWCSMRVPPKDDVIYCYSTPPRSEWLGCVHSPAACGLCRRAGGMYGYQQRQYGQYTSAGGSRCGPCQARAMIACACVRAPTLAGRCLLRVAQKCAADGGVRAVAAHTAPTRTAKTRSSSRARLGCQNSRA